MNKSLLLSMAVAALSPGAPFLPSSEPGKPHVPSEFRPQSQSLIQRFQDSGELTELQTSIERGTFTGDPNEAIARTIARIQRGLTSATSAFPVRENLEAEAHVLTPVETPLRNILPRSPGAGLAAQFRQLTSFGAGLGTLALTSGTTNAVNTLTLANARGFFVGETFLYNATSFTITAINYTTNVISVASGITLNSQTNGQQVIKTSYFFPESGQAAPIFFGESGAPNQSTESYANKTVGYKLLGDMGNITMFAMAAGNNFQNQYATAKQNCLYRTMLKEEYALLHSVSGVVAAPWGDGTTALGYQGLIDFINNNSPAAQIQTGVGVFTIEHVHKQLTRIHYNGGRKKFILINGQEAESLTKLATNTGNYRVILSNDKGMVVGGKVGSIVHAVSGEEVPIYVHPFLPIGMMVFGSLANDMGQPTCDLEVLPQTQLPESTFMDGIQGYYAQEIAPTAAAPEVLNFKVSCYQVPKWKNALVFAISTGLTPA